MPIAQEVVGEKYQEMSLPDKIFIHEFEELGAVSKLWKETEVETGTDHPYISQEFLLEHLKTVKRAIETDIFIDSSIKKGAIWEIEEIIKFIKAL